MADIVNTLDRLIQPQQHRAHPPRFVPTCEIEDHADDAVQAQIQYDVIDRAYFCTSLCLPLLPTPNGKAEDPCPSCMDDELTLPTWISRRPKAVKTTGSLYDMVIPYVNTPAPEIQTTWISQRCQPAEWDLYDDEIKVDLERKIEKQKQEALRKPLEERKREDDLVPRQGLSNEDERAPRARPAPLPVMCDRDQVLLPTANISDLTTEERRAPSLGNSQRMLQRKRGRYNLNL